MHVCRALENDLEESERADYREKKEGSNQDAKDDWIDTLLLLLLALLQPPDEPK